TTKQTTTTPRSTTTQTTTTTPKPTTTSTTAGFSVNVGGAIVVSCARTV
ncbi:unnamed protein product, partial [Rotaria sp. Silwood1]